ncbi:MAG: LuxR C-terminal-related transcriptional regulator [Rubrivivax sp.]
MRLAELLCPLAAAADIGAALPPATAQRTSLIALGLAEALGLPAAARSDLFYAGLLRHLGCSATAHEETQLMGDEQALRSSLALADKASPAQLLAGAARGFARGGTRWQRTRVVAGFMVQAPSAVPRILAARCEVSAMLGRRLGLGEAALLAIDQTYERFDSRGAPRRLRGEALSPLAAALAVAECAAMLLPLPGGEALAMQTLEQRAGGEFDPAAVRALVGAREALLRPARQPAPTTALLAAEPPPHRTVDDALTIAGVLADARGHEVALHARPLAPRGRTRAPRGALARPAAGGSGSDRPCRAAARPRPRGHLQRHLGQARPARRGRVGQVKSHPQHTERIVASAPPWSALATLAAADHERMDGSGYPRGGPPSPAARLLAAADVLCSLGEARAHRPALPREAWAPTLAEEVRCGRLERSAANAVLEGAGEPRLRAAAPHGLTEREVQVLQALARGRVDKQIAAELGISHRTVHHHNQAIFGKLGVTTRGAAALFAIEHGLV